MYEERCRLRLNVKVKVVKERFRLKCTWWRISLQSSSNKQLCLAHNFLIARKACQFAFVAFSFYCTYEFKTAKATPFAYPLFIFFSSNFNDGRRIRHGPFDIQGGGGLGFLVWAKIFFSDKIGARLFFSTALRARLFFFITESTIYNI